MAKRRVIVTEILPTAGSERTACRWLGFHRSAVRYQRRTRDELALRERLRDLADKPPRWGCPMFTHVLRREGVRDNHKRIRRLYRSEGLAVARKGYSSSPTWGVRLLTASTVGKGWVLTAFISAWCFPEILAIRRITRGERSHVSRHFGLL